MTGSNPSLWATPTPLLRVSSALFTWGGRETSSAATSLLTVINPNTLGIQSYAPIKNYLYMNISNAFTVACGTCESLLNSTNGYNVLEDMFWTKGMHHFSFGVNYLRNTLVSDGVNNANGQFNFTGQYTKDGLVDFMLGEIQSLYQGNNSGVDFRKNYAGLYFQDSIQFSPRFTMNAGLRWATGLPAIETTGRGASFSLADYECWDQIHCLSHSAGWSALLWRPGDSTRLLPRQMEPA